MTVESVLHMLSLISNTKLEKLKKYSEYVGMAIKKVTEQCRAEVKHEEESILNMLCAAMVNLWICLANSSTLFTMSFAGTGYKITKDHKIQLNNALKLVNKLRVEAAHLLKDEDFVFIIPKDMKEK